VAASDRSLRQMVARMPSLSASDFDAVMDSLSAAQRSTVVDMLREFDEGERSATMLLSEPLDYKPLVVPDDLSPWLAARVNGNPASGDEVVEQFSMTIHAVTALRECAAALVPQPEIRSGRPSLFDQLWQRISTIRRVA
jgi:hypothetical protein